MYGALYIELHTEFNICFNRPAIAWVFHVIPLLFRFPDSNTVHFLIATMRAAWPPSSSSIWSHEKYLTKSTHGTDARCAVCSIPLFLSPFWVQINIPHLNLLSVPSVLLHAGTNKSHIFVTVVTLLRSTILRRLELLFAVILCTLTART